ncbi:MAG: GT4 family glycosyltransferase PelF [Myxococcales bacterium]|nr:GT4 family glycosyltransferase PelF [Myxococcales bacterium]
MAAASAPKAGVRRADVCMVLEGTYPYVPGGVSSWCHDIIKSLPELSFNLLHIGPKAGAYGAPRYAVPDNVTGMVEHYCQGAEAEVSRADLERTIRAARRTRSAAPSRTLRALRRLHLEPAIDDALLADLAEADLSLDALLHGDEAFETIREIARVRCPAAPFVTMFWHFRSMHVPLIRLLSERAPQAAVYHAVSTGYAGAVAAVASHRTNRPMLLTEHGIYSRERDMELARATWDDTAGGDARLPATASQLRQLWSTFFLKLSQLAYHRAHQIVTLSEVNRGKEIEDGAAAEKIAIVPNGVDVDALVAAAAPPTPRPQGAPVRIGFVGRVVPIKDVITFVKACDLAMRDVALDVEIIGPAEEDSAYAARCTELVELLGRTAEIRFVGPRKLAEIYGKLDICVLTSFSEGQPLVILEAHAQGVPVIATDVGACREMLEGRADADLALGPGGIVTSVAAPEETAAAMVKLARSQALRTKMGEAGRARVRAFYSKSAMIDAYRGNYTWLKVEA